MGRKGAQRKRGLAARKPTWSQSLVGRSFVHPVFDYLLIGGALSLVVTAIVVTKQVRFEFGGIDALAYLILLSNSAHFAASTVRLYTKPGVYESLPLLTMAFPLVAAGLLTLCMFQADALGPHLQSLYLTWSPFHYGAQAYGLAVMYCFRSGCLLTSANKRLLYWVCMVAFFYAFVKGNRTGLEWILPQVVYEHASVQAGIDVLGVLLKYMAFAAPVILFLTIWLSQGVPMPLIGLLLIVTNGIWWIMLPVVDAFVWATVFHGIQYLAIVIVFHLRDQQARPSNRHGMLYHIVWFYGACILLGYGLFQCMPWAYQLAGFGAVESILLVVAAINIHHFIVDAFIWRLKQGDSNRRVVDSGQPVPA